MSLILNGFELQHGDSLFTRGGGPNLIGPLIRNLEGDFDWEHTCSVWRIEDQWRILTTGAAFDPKHLAFTYGMVPAAEYLENRAYAVGRWNDMNWYQQEARLKTLLRLAERRAPYATAKVLQLAARGRLGARVVNQLHRVPDLKPVKVYCAEAEAYGRGEGLMQLLNQKAALARINSKYPNKAEYCVHTPETLFDSPNCDIVFSVNR